MYPLPQRLCVQRYGELLVQLPELWQKHFAYRVQNQERHTMICELCGKQIEDQNNPDRAYCDTCTQNNESPVEETNMPVWQLVILFCFIVGALLFSYYVLLQYQIPDECSEALRNTNHCICDALRCRLP